MWSASSTSLLTARELQASVTYTQSPPLFLLRSVSYFNAKCFLGGDFATFLFFIFPPCIPDFFPVIAPFCLCLCSYIPSKGVEDAAIPGAVGFCVSGPFSSHSCDQKQLWDLRCIQARSGSSCCTESFGTWITDGKERHIPVQTWWGQFHDIEMWEGIQNDHRSKLELLTRVRTVTVLCFISLFIRCHSTQATLDSLRREHVQHRVVNHSSVFRCFSVTGSCRETRGISL